MQICCSQSTAVYNTLQFLNTNDVEVVFTSLVSRKKMELQFYLLLNWFKACFKSCSV